MVWNSFRINEQFYLLSYLLLSKIFCLDICDFPCYLLYFLLCLVISRVLCCYLAFSRVNSCYLGLSSLALSVYLNCPSVICNFPLYHMVSPFIPRFLNLSCVFFSYPAFSVVILRFLPVASIIFISCCLALLSLSNTMQLCNW